MKTMKQLLEERKQKRDAAANKRKEARELHGKADTEKRDRTPEEVSKRDGLLDEADKLDEEIRSLDDEIQKREADQNLTERMNRNTPEGRAANIPRGPEVGEDRNDPVTNPDSAKYSLMRAINLRAAGKEVDGYEGEISAEIAKRTGKEATGFYMPLALGLRSDLPRGTERRSNLDVTAGAGAIPTMLASDRFIDALRARTVLGSLGVTVLNDLVGEMDIPKKTGVSTAYDVGESENPAASNITIGTVELRAKTLGGNILVTRKMRKQTSMAVENMARMDLSDTINLGLDYRGINGDADQGQSDGLLQMSGVTTVAIDTNGGAPTWAKVVELETSVADANADAARMSYLTSAVGRGKLKTTVKAAGTSADFLMDKDGTVNGYPCAVSNQVPKNLTKAGGSNLTAMLFGDFSQLVLALWGGADVIVDPYTHSKNGDVIVAMLIDYDWQVRHAQAFAKIVDMVRT